MHRRKFGGYEICLEKSHTSAKHETVISLRAVYRKLAPKMADSVKIPRSKVPPKALAVFDVFQEGVYWDYIEQLS